ncbi:MAG: hypothetical protein ACM3ON_02285 [Chloroflexota bacterium]
MITYGEFLRIFQGTGFSREDLRNFYRSVKKSVVLMHLGKRAWTELFKIEEGCQWPVLQRIDNPHLPIYRGADKDLLDAFIETIRQERDIRRQGETRARADSWIALQAVIETRTKLFMQIFGFTKKDKTRCEAVAERYRTVLEKRVQHRKKAWKIAVGAGAATAVASAAVLWYLSKKDQD